MEDQDIHDLIEGVERADSAVGLLMAVRSLASSGHKKAIPVLIEALGYNNPGAAVAAVEGLINLGDVSVPYLLQQIDGYNYGARAWATRALAGIGHPSALDHLQEAALTDFSMSVRRSAAKGLGYIGWSKLSGSEAFDGQKQATETLFKVLEDPEWVVRYAAVVGLQNLAISLDKESLVNSIVERLEKQLEIEEESGVCARVQLALQEVEGSQESGVRSQE
ncbi:HEAT repeat domain-containing protein [Crocosphaera chwakensis]|uniref:Phycocyanin alpha phycocyanobilin lyase CpcF n=1 Tax=Crocosphaera chwakensis CCY0110 TaxID=391612 RepID=A3IUN5_9CHRO|nr:HEAT repeat domain-containing protein [Crocosphaera chwakensis]EAZ89827.1 phycocyanin alpha phycocyanobilin lyase; CpcF [Crocosphaera chwakensis CCY0110]